MTIWRFFLKLQHCKVWPWPQFHSFSTIVAFYNDHYQQFYDIRAMQGISVQNVKYKFIIKAGLSYIRNWVHLRGPVIQANGKLTFEDDLRSGGQEVCYISLHSKPASALSLPTVWLHWGNLGVARCWEMATLPAGYIPQRKLPSASSSGSLFHCVCEVL